MGNISELKLYASALAAFLVLSPLPAGAEEITGRPRAIDGDTLEVDGNRIHLFGIDAPEINQTCVSGKGKTYGCGRLAAMALRDMIYSIDLRNVVCKGDRRNEQGELIAVCRVGLLVFNEQMVLEGWAMADRKYGEKYIRAEKFAKALGKGIWKGKFDPPWEWRKANPQR